MRAELVNGRFQKVGIKASVYHSLIFMPVVLLFYGIHNQLISFFRLCLLVFITVDIVIFGCPTKANGVST